MSFTVPPNRILNKKWKCNSCHPSRLTVIPGVNSMWDTAPEIAKYLLNPEDGYKYTKCSNVRVDWKCINCGEIIKDRAINNVSQNGRVSCPVCSDGVSFPNKLMYNLLTQLNIEFEREKSFDWCRFTIGEDNRRGNYDFYFVLNKKKYIVEMDGVFHYKHNPLGNLSLEYLILIDNKKTEVAALNGCKVIRIDCFYPEIEYIKSNIYNSILSELFDLDSIDWNLCYKNSLRSMVIEASNLWNSGIKSTTQIANILRTSKGTVTRYLKNATEAKLCDYDVNFARNYSSQNSVKNVKPVLCITTGKSFNTLKEASNFYNINYNSITKSCKDKNKSAGKLKDGTKLFWKYAS